MSSDRTAGRLSRILALIPYVLAKDGAKVSEIIERFDYTEEDLTRDLNTVFFCGLPGYTPGDLMEAYIDGDEVIIDAADYFAKAPRLTPMEALGLMAAGMAIIGSGQGSPDLKTAVDKLTKALLPDAGSAIDVDVSGDSENLSILKSAAADQQVIRIRYRSMGRETETVREIEPWAVVSTLGNWYVQAFCRLVGGERVFRVDRIRDLEVLDERFQRPEAPTEPEIAYTPSEEDVVARIRLETSARWVLDYYPVDVVKETKTGTEIRFSSPDAEIPARLLLRLGGQARLLDGEEVRARVTAIAGALRERYTTGRET
ncbi:MAG TPA: WYL domain-containing protein [Acidimicrobiia bacterium]|nr:WYL domain-containing protein [Acidimicrobiia bacterium]